jgi:hypothetical protein
MPPQERKKRRVDCFAPLAMTADAASRSRRAFRASLALDFPPSPVRGRRECRVHAAPAVSCAIVRKKNAHEHTGSAEAIRHSLRNGFNGFLRALPGDRAFLPPSPALLSANLTPASGCQDHTTSPSAHTPFVIGASASTASRPAAVTIACRPSVGRNGEDIGVIWGRWK